MALDPYEYDAIEAALSGNEDAFERAYAVPEELSAPVPVPGAAELGATAQNMSIDPGYGMSEQPAASEPVNQGLQGSVFDAPQPVQRKWFPDTQQVPAEQNTQQAIDEYVSAIAAPPTAAENEATGNDLGVGRRDIISQMVLASGQPRRSRHIPAQTLPTQTSVEGRQPLPEGAMDAEMAAREQQAGAAETAGYDASIAAQEAAQAAKRRKVEIAADRAEFEIEQDDIRKQLQERESEYAQMVEQSAVDPKDFWRDEDSQSRAFKVIGAIMLGLSGNAGKIAEIVDKDTAMREQQRDRELAVAGKQLDSFRDRMLSPEAQLNYETSLKLRIAAEDAEALAQQAAGEAERNRGLQLAAELRALAEARKVDALREEQAVIRQGYQYQPARTVGGGGGLSDMAKFLGSPPEKGGLGLPAEEVLYQLNSLLSKEGGTLDFERLSRFGLKPEAVNAQLHEQKANLERRVTLPDGNFAWATTKERADKAQGQIDDVGRFKRNVQRQLEISRRTLASLTPTEVQEYNNLAAQNTLLLKGVEDLGAITEADQAMVEPMTLGNRNKLRNLQATTEKVGQTVLDYAEFREKQAYQQLFADPDAQTPVRESEGALGIVEE